MDLLKLALKFFGLSGIGWLMDMAVYSALCMFSSRLFLNNTISSWVGVTFVFITSTRTLFKNNSRMPLKVKYLVYLLYQAALIYLISKLLVAVSAFIVSFVPLAFVQKMSALIAKIIVTPVTMVLNFFVMKLLIEKL